MRSLRSTISGFAVPSVVALSIACGGARSDDGGEAVAAAGQASSTCATTPVVDRSLFVTDATALASFSFEDVLTAIVTTGSTSGQTALGLYQQMLDTLNDKANGVTSGPHCDDVLTNGSPSINGFSIQCPRQEGKLAKTNPFKSGPQSFIPLGLVNRFDLAPANGANCGQYRVVFGMDGGKTGQAVDGVDRLLIIFEAVLPNPKPADGLTGCLPVAQFWDDLSSNASATSRAAKLKSFYFTGLPGFDPVILAQNYGIGRGTNTGQIRANMFSPNALPPEPNGSTSSNSALLGEWELREFRLSQTCTKTPKQCTLIADNTFVQNNPFGGLFGGTSTAATAFQKEFIGQVAALSATTIPAISMATPNVDNAGESDEQDSSNDYLAQGQVNTTLTAAITKELKALGNKTLTADDILNRATTQSCAGCHQVATGVSLGGGLTWPQSNGFTQIDENQNLSPALTQFFLPARAAVLESFLNQNCGDAGAATPLSASATTSADVTIGGSAVGSAN